MKLSQCIQQKEYYNYLKRSCEAFAFNYNYNIDDILSDCLFTIAKSINARDPDLEFPNTYLYSVARTTVFSFGKSKKRKLDIVDEISTEIPGNSNINFEHADFLKYVDMRIRKRFASNKKDIEVYECCILHGLDNNKVADEINITEGNVRVRKSRIISYAKNITDHKAKTPASLDGGDKKKSM